MITGEDQSNLTADFQRTGKRKAEVALSSRSSITPVAGISDQISDDKLPHYQAASPPKTRRILGVYVPPVRDKKEYVFYDAEDEVERIVLEYSRSGEIMYEVKLLGGQTKHIAFGELLELSGGPEALQKHQPEDDRNETSSADEQMARGLTRNARAKHNEFVDITKIKLSDDDNDMDIGISNSRNGHHRATGLRKRRNTRSSQARKGHTDNTDLFINDDSNTGVKKRKLRRKAESEVVRRSSRPQVSVHSFSEEESGEDDEEDKEDEDDSSESDILRSDVLLGGKRKRRVLRTGKLKNVPRVGVRQSDRVTRATNNMEEAGMDDVYRSDSEPRISVPKIAPVRETFETLPRSDLFRSRHAEGCESCFSGPNVAPLIYCQGCSLAYHKSCLGIRANREHLVTKVGPERYVLQCKRCVNVYQKRDRTSPNLSRCQDCAQTGASCKPFRQRKTPQQELKDREENNGQDPMIEVPTELINNAFNILFRCTKCSQAWHYHHLPPLSQYAMDILRNEQEMAEERFLEYSRKWLCKDCESTESQKVGGIIAWRPSNVESYVSGTPCEKLSEDEKQYLIKWEDRSYFQAAWFSGAWTWGVTASGMRKAFYKREDGPKMHTEDAIPEEYLRIDIVLDVKYTSFVEFRTEEIDKARIKEVDKALIKYKGLGYEDAVWEKVPTSDDGDRWLDLVTAYNDWVAGRYVKYPKQGQLKARLDKARNTPFAKLEKQKQPENLVGGELMKYQMEGLNWLYYQWYSQKNGILADEMGLGKTIQVIGFMATLVQEHNCYPFLVVVPNSTCANWRREIKQWVPSLRVVTYFGSSQSRQMAYKYEMYPEKAKELRCHIVVTSYETASDDSSRKLFHSVTWGGLIVDEGQRLKNDKSQLYNALATVKAPFRLLMTGTPLQNNARELFNLLQFLDDSIKAADLEEKYADMTTENIKEMHEQIRPFILRRTKAQVLTFLPPLGQVILPISMSHLQKQLYKSILSKSPELLKALFTSDKSLKQQERANLTNILMQLRKCLCHPFVYSREIEERTDVVAVSHRNLVEASAKLSLLELLLPKLKERCHRVLIFSQFLDMLDIVEDFLDGMQMAYQRLDGRMGSLEKQKRIDHFNAPDSPLFAFLLSTRAGGVGINLATADTVIILDPDWNPHQDLQAIARAHRIGQKKKVLCFQLMTRGSVEEKMIQMGRKKMALDHVVVEQLDAEDIEDQDLESILKFGAAELFKEENADQDIRYEDASIERLLDRSQIENTPSNDSTVESQFSFARVWANDTGTLQDNLDVTEEEVAPDPGVWDKILKERQAAAAAEALARAEAMGRGRRARGNIDYVIEKDGVDALDRAESDVSEDNVPDTPVPEKPKKRRQKTGFVSDTDFKADTTDESEGGAGLPPVEDNELRAPEAAKGIIPAAPSALQNGKGGFHNSSKLKSTPAFPSVTFTISSTSASTPSSKSALKPPTPNSNPHNTTATPHHHSFVIDTPATHHSSRPHQITSKTNTPNVKLSHTNPNSPTKPFIRARIPIRTPLDSSTFNPTMLPPSICPACADMHPPGACALKLAGPEHCGLCGLAHFGHSRTCPHIKSETQVREMLEALKKSPESKELVDAAMKYLRGVKGTLVQQKKKERERITAMAGTRNDVNGLHTGGQQWMPLVGAQQYHAHAPKSANEGRIFNFHPTATAAQPNRPPQQTQQKDHPAPFGSQYPAIHSNSNSSHYTQGQQHGQDYSAHAADEQYMESTLRGFLER